VPFACNDLGNAGTPAADQSGNPVQRGVGEDAARSRRTFRRLMSTIVDVLHR